MFCTKCGTEISKDSAFCTNCGNAMKKNKMGKITFHRMGRFVGCLIGIAINIDGKAVGSISNNGTLEVNVPIGKHKVIFDLWSGVNQEEIEVTEEYPNVFVDIKLKVGLITNKTSIVNIRREKKGD